MVNNTKKTASSSKKTAKKTTTSSTRSGGKRKVIDPMMVSVKKANEDDLNLTQRAELNGVGIDESDDFLNDSAYDIDDLYDDDGNLIIDEADEALKVQEKKTTRKTEKTPGRRTKTVRQKTQKRDSFIEEEDDWSEDDLIEDEAPLSKKELERKRNAEKKAFKKKRKAEKKAKRRTPIWAKIVIAFLILVIIAILAAGTYIYMAMTKASNVFEGNPMDILIGAPLAKDEYGRTNVLVFGTAEDDEGHGGAELTDSILVVSLDQEKKIGATFSVPRDLWVNYTVPGEESMWCTVGYKGKINATYFCAKNANDGDKEKGTKYFSKKISEITGLNIQYYVAVDFRVLRDVVNTLGGIDVDVHSTDDRGIYDICMHNLTLKKGMNYNLNGDQVLDLARARNAKGGYGLANSNFDREINQQHIMNAIKDKALSLGIVANPTKVLGMLDDLGNNIRTNVTMAEMRTVIDFVAGMNGDLQSIDTRKQFGTGRIGSQSVVIPAGASTDVNSSSLYNYMSLQRYLRKQIDAQTEKFELDQKKAEMEKEAENK